MNTGGLKNFFRDNGWEKSTTTPRVGDIALWYQVVQNEDGTSKEEGHVGIITEVNEDGTFSIVHAKGKNSGVVEETNQNTGLSSKSFAGFFRPESEEKSEEKKEDKKYDISTTQGRKDFWKASYDFWKGKGDKKSTAIAEHMMNSIE